MQEVAASTAIVVYVHNNDFLHSILRPQSSSVLKCFEVDGDGKEVTTSVPLHGSMLVRVLQHLVHKDEHVQHDFALQVSHQPIRPTVNPYADHVHKGKHVEQSLRHPVWF